MWSAVVNLKEDSTMQDVENLAEHFESKYGWQCYQIAIHRDEGHFDDNNEKVINHHAHLEFVMLDKNGITAFKKRDFPKWKMRQIQTEVAEILGMERGVDKRISRTKRIEPRKYAQMKEIERKNIKKALQENTKKYASLEKITYYAKDALEEAAKELEFARNEILTLKQQKQILEVERKKWIQEGNHTAEEYKKLRELVEKQGKEKEQLLKEIEQLNTQLFIERQKHALELQKKDEQYQHSLKGLKSIKTQASYQEIRIQELEEKKEMQPKLRSKDILGDISKYNDYSNQENDDESDDMGGSFKRKKLK